MKVQPARVNLTAGRIAAFSCPAGKSQAFLWDSDAPSLLLRATPKGRKTYVFENRLHGKTIRRTVGTVETWTLSQARAEARRLQVLIDAGTDPRELEREQQAEAAVQQARVAAQAMTVGEAWAAYVKSRTPHWGDQHRNDHDKMVRAGGEPARRGTQGRGVTTAGPLYPLLALRLADLNTARLSHWAVEEGTKRPTQARLARRLLRAFLNWCMEDARYAVSAPVTNPAGAKKVRQALGTPKAKHDHLEKSQLPAWFAAVQGISNATISAYLQALLLTGARSGELLALQWEDVNTQWRSLTLRDKAESKGGEDGTRTIPLTPYVWHLLAGLPRRGPYVFAGVSGEPASRLHHQPTKGHRIKSHPREPKPISRPHHQLTKACTVAGINGLTPHGLRRSFKSLSEWLELPTGVVAQIMGHKPSATAEKHYTVRPLDLLRLHHEKLEA